MPYNELFLEKNVKISERWGLRSQTPSALGGWWLCPQTTVFLSSQLLLV